MRGRKVGRPIGEFNKEEFDRNVDRMVGLLVKGLNAGALAEEALRKAEQSQKEADKQVAQ
jgi:hypothetical protein